jgi:hypothetical protein
MRNWLDMKAESIRRMSIKQISEQLAFRNDQEMSKLNKLAICKQIKEIPYKKNIFRAGA